MYFLFVQIILIELVWYNMFFLNVWTMVIFLYNSLKYLHIRNDHTADCK